MADKQPSFFGGRRVSVYFKGGRMLKDKKTEQRFWRMKWIISVGDNEAHACGGAIESTYQHMQARENAADKVELAGENGGMTARVFATDRGESAELIYLAECYFKNYAMEYAGDGATKLFFELEHPLTDQLHKFVKDHAFTRFGVDFTPKQMTLLEGIAENLAKDAGGDLQALADRDGVTMTLESHGKKLAEFKPKGRVQ